MRQKIFILLAVILFFTSGVYATGINVFIQDGAIKNNAGSALPNGDYHPYQAKLEFFYNALPAPNSSSGRMTVGSDKYTKVGDQNKYQLSSLDGGTLYVRAWSGTVATLGSYYAKGSNGVAAGTTLPYDWGITDFKTSYKADVPYAPTIGGITESMVRSGDNLQLALAVSVGYNENGADGKREVTGLSLDITYPDGTKETKSGSSFTLANTAQGTYLFKPSATNWFGTTAGSEISYATLGIAGGGAAGPVTYQLRKAADGNVGLNAVAVLHEVPFKVNCSPEASVRYIDDLVRAINLKAGANIVTAFGWIEPAGQIRGFYIGYDAAGLPVYTATAGVTGTAANIELIRGKACQISVLNDVSVTFSQ